MKIFKHLDHGGIPQLITKSNWVGQAVYGHAKSMMAFPTRLLVLHLLGNCFQEELPRNFPKVWSWALWYLFFSCPWGATPLSQKGVTLVCSCKSQMHILPCLYMHFVPNLSDSRQCFLPQSVASGVWDTWEEILPEKTEAKKAISTSRFSVHFISSSSPPLPSSELALSLVSLLLLLYLWSLCCLSHSSSPVEISVSTPPGCWSSWFHPCMLVHWVHVLPGWPVPVSTCVVCLCSRVQDCPVRSE